MRARTSCRSTVSFGTGEYLVAWGGASGVRGTRVLPDGTVLDPNGFSISTGNVSPSGSAFGGMYHVVVWSKDDGPTDSIHAARVDADGNVLDPNSIVLASGQGILTQAPRIAYDGTNFLVVWAEVRGAEDVFGARLAPDGTVLDPGGFQITHGVNAERYPDVTFDGENYLVAYNGSGGTSYDVFGVRVDPNGVVVDPDPFPIKVDPEEQLLPRVGSDGQRSLVLWYDTPGDDLLGTRVDRDGSVLDPGGFPISAAMFSQQNPQVTFGAGQYFVVWEDDRLAGPPPPPPPPPPAPGVHWFEIFGARVTPDAEVLDPDGIQISVDSTPPPARLLPLHRRHQRLLRRHRRLHHRLLHLRLHLHLRPTSTSATSSASTSPPPPAPPPPLPPPSVPRPTRDRLEAPRARRDVSGGTVARSERVRRSRVEHGRVTRRRPAPVGGRD